MTREISLSVNDKPIQTDYFIARFIDHTVGGMLAALEGTGDIGVLTLDIDEGEQVTINLNNAQVPINPFVNRIILSTITGLVSTLKGVDEIKKLHLTLKR